jgi:DNA-binding transcriptional LysR family regulator
MLDLRELKTFQTVASQKSVTRAAVVLHYAQSTVTAQIQSLEAEVGVPLFDRIGRRLELTLAGRQLLGYAGRLLDLANEAARALRNDGRLVGTLTVIAPETLLAYRLPELLRKFQSQYPGIHLSLAASESCGTGGHIEPNVDIAFTLDTLLRAPNVIVEQLRREPIVLVVSPAHPLAGKARVRAEAIAAQQVLVTERSCSYRELFERALGSEGVSVLNSLEFLSVEAIKQCALASMGVAILPEVVVRRDLESGALVAVDWPRKPLAVCTQIYRHRDKWMSPVMTVFWDLAVALLRSPDEVKGKGSHSSLLETV